MYQSNGIASILYENEALGRLEMLRCALESIIIRRSTGGGLSSSSKHSHCSANERRAAPATSPSETTKGTPLPPTAHQLPGGCLHLDQRDPTTGGPAAGLRSTRQASLAKRTQDRPRIGCLNCSAHALVSATAASSSTALPNSAWDQNTPSLYPLSLLVSLVHPISAHGLALWCAIASRGEGRPSVAGMVNTSTFDPVSVIG